MLHLSPFYGIINAMKGDFSMNNEMLDFILKQKMKKEKHPMKDIDEPKNDIDYDEAIEIYQELIEVFAKHNVSYQCACRLSLALNEALVSGAVELINLEYPNG